MLPFSEKHVFNNMLWGVPFMTLNRAITIGKRHEVCTAIEAYLKETGLISSFQDGIPCTLKNEYNDLAEHFRHSPSAYSIGM